MKDKEKNLEELDVVKQYFTRIFTVLSKDIREKILKLDLEEEEKKKILRELAFLTEDKQNEYLEELYRKVKKTLK